MNYSFDTSALTKVYHHELGSRRAIEIFNEKGAIIRISNLAIVEVQSAFAMKVRTGIINQQWADWNMNRVFDDLAINRLSVNELNQSHMDCARSLVAKYGYTRRLRTLDALQLAVALDLHRRGLTEVFVVADKLLVEVAIAEGLAAENPEVNEQ